MRWAPATILVGMAMLPASAHAQDASSSFAQLTGERGCVAQQAGPLVEDVLEGCARARGLLSAYAVTVSPDDRHVYVASSGAGAVGSNGVAAFSRAADTGAVTAVGCVTDSGGDGRPGSDGFCGNGDALLGASDIAVSPDGRNVYVASHSSNGISWLARNADTGALTPVGCIKEIPRADRCRGGFWLEGTSGVAVSPDGEYVYVTADSPGSVSVYSRDADTGNLERVMCVSETGSDGLCVDGTALGGASDVTVAPDGRQVVVTAAGVGAVTTYMRDADGRLTPQACLLTDAPRGGSCTDTPALGGAASSAITPDGKTLLVASAAAQTLTLFARDPGTGAVTRSSCFEHQEPTGDESLEEEEFDEEEEADEEEAEDAQGPDCKPAIALSTVDEVVVSPDGRGVFTVAAGDYMAAFRRDAASGELTQTGCAEDERTYRSCSQARGVSGGRGLAVSSDARSLYLANPAADAVAVFGASVAVTSRAAKVDRRGRFRVRLACPAARVRGCAGRLRVGAARTRGYRVRAGAARSVRARLPQRLRRVVRKQGRVRVTVAARDTRGLMRPSKRRVLLRR